MRGAVDAVAQFAQEPRFGTLTSPVRRHISGVARTEMPALAGEWAAALRPRLRSLEDDLASIGRHHAGIVTRLGGMVGQALRTLRLAQRLSELPEGLGDWSGQQFLRIRFDDVDEVVLRHALGDVVDRAAEQQVTGKGPGRRDGMALLLAGVRAAMPKGVRVEMLKPDAVLRTERLRVAQIRDVFSGGQRLTAAIVLYCTMAALRAHQRGHGRRPHAGVLFLDNPIGRASRGLPAGAAVRGGPCARRAADLHDRPLRRGCAERVPADRPAAQRRRPAGGPQVPLDRRRDRPGAGRARRTGRLRPRRRDAGVPPPRAGVNPRSERLAELIAQQQRKRIHQPRLMALYAEADPMSAGSVDRRRLLAEALAELVADGLVKRAARDDDGQPPLPRYVDRVTTPKPVAARRAVIWHADLGWAAERRLTDRQFQLLEAVNEWIFKRRAGAAEVPLRGTGAADHR